MRRTMVFLLLLLLSLPLYSQSSSEPDKSSMTCFTQEQLDEMEAKAVRIMEDAVAEAVNEAVKPYVITVKRQEWELRWWKIGFWTAVAAAAGSLVWAAVK